MSKFDYMLSAIIGTLLFGLPGCLGALVLVRLYHHYQMA